MILYGLFALLCWYGVFLQAVDSGYCNQKWSDLKTMEYCIANNTVKNYSVAENMCQSYHGHLAALIDSEVQDFIISEILKYANFPPFQFYVGLSQYGLVFRKNNSDASSGFTFWGPRQQFNGSDIITGNEEFSNDTWNTVTEGSISAKYICERFSQKDGCSKSGHPCDDEASCIYIRGKFFCICNAGYGGNGITCSDVDECLFKIHNCHTNAICLNVPGSYTCVCDQGYSGNGTFCTDINECSENLSDCHNDAHCVNNDGGYSCSCNSGYTGNGANCTDFDECLSTSHSCQSFEHCINTNGSYHCYCNSGYIWKDMKCSDINECDDDAHNCSENGVCTNVPGTFVCTCKSGFNGIGVKCEDVDECLANTHLCFGLECVNWIGSYTCVCDPGYTWNGTGCIDVDECATMVTYCHSDATCFNEVGSFVCKCDDGYTGTGVNCTDIDECSSNSFNCPERTTCANIVGTYTCICGQGLVWSRDECIEVPTQPMSTLEDTAPPTGRTKLPLGKYFQNFTFHRTDRDRTDQNLTNDAVMQQGRRDKRNGDDTTTEKQSTTVSHGHIIFGHPAIYIASGGVIGGLLCLLVASLMANIYLKNSAIRNDRRQRERQLTRAVQNRRRSTITKISQRRNSSSSSKGVPTLKCPVETPIGSDCAKSSSEDEVFF